MYENDLNLLKDLHKAHEGRIKASEEDPIRYGFNLPGWERIKEGLQDHNECLALGGNRSGKTTGFAKIIMESVTESNDGHIVCFSQNEDTSIKVQLRALSFLILVHV